MALIKNLQAKEDVLLIDLRITASTKRATFRARGNGNCASNKCCIAGRPTALQWICVADEFAFCQKAALALV